MEKKIFSERRMNLLNDYPSLINTERWGKYCYLPLDIPKFDNNNLVDWFFSNSIPSVRNELNTVKTYYNSISDPSVFENYCKANKDNITNESYSIYNSVDVIIDRSATTKYSMWSYNIRDDFLHLFSDFYRQILDAFPFKKLKSFRIWSSTGDFSLHRDMHESFVDFPNLFRIMLYDENPNSTLYVNNVLPGSKCEDSNFYVPRITDTNSFAINNLRTKHASTFQPPYKKILILLDNYEIDTERMNELMQRSVNKYHDQLLMDHRDISEYVILN
jgi:hypothetical protein